MLQPADTHRFPRCGGGPKGKIWSKRLPYETAMRQRYIDLMDAGRSYAGFTLDIDEPAGLAAIPDLPPPNWYVQTDRGAHLTWLLRVPVHKHDAARLQPLSWFGSIADRFGIACMADPAFNGMGRNPFHPAARTLPGALKLYTLDELANAMTGDIQIPKARQGLIGRNVTLFRGLL